MSAARTDLQHPIRAAELHVFEGVGNAAGRFVARFHPYDTYPIIFTGPSADAVTKEAEAFRTSTIAKHEAAFAVRAAARARSRTKRAAKGKDSK